MKQLVWGVFFCALMLLAAGCERDKEWQRDGQSGAYAYPLTASSPEWDSFSHAEKIEACAIPERVLADVNDEELVELVLAYPLLEEISYYRDFAQGVSAVAAFFPPLRTVIEEGMLTAYQKEHCGADGAPVLPEASENSEELVQSLFLSCEQEMPEFYEEEGITELLNAAWERNEKTGVYEYPYTAETQPEVWGTLTHAGQAALCEAPPAVLADVNDEELVELVLKYPLLSDLYFFGNDFQESLEHIAGHCRALRLVLERDLFPDYFRTHMDESGRLAMRYGETADQKLAQAFAEKYMEEFGVRP